MIEHLVSERGLSREEAYILSSVAVDLKISEIVDAPNCPTAFGTVAPVVEGIQEEPCITVS